MRRSARAGPEEKLGRNRKRAVAQWSCFARCLLVAGALGLSATGSAQTPNMAGGADLPEAPSAQMSRATAGSGQSEEAQAKPAGEEAAKAALRPCKDSDYVMEKMPLQGPPPCIPENPISPYVTSMHIQPLTSKEKGLLAIRDFLDPFNFITIAGYSAIAIAENSHSAYGSGMKGVATLTGYGLVEDAQGEFFQTYAIPSLVHQDPRYHRMPSGSVKRRIGHAVRHTFVSEHDDGTGMPNYATLGTYVISAELSNLYVPGLQTDAKATARRIGVGIATDPAGALAAEFLPDVARHIHINVRFIQNILDTVATGSPNTE